MTNERLRKLARDLRVLIIVSLECTEDGEYLDPGESSATRFKLSRSQKALVRGNAVKRRETILLNGQLTDLRRDLAHELGHHLSFLAHGQNTRVDQKQEPEAAFFRAFRLAGFTATPETTEELRAETLGQFLLGTKLSKTLQAVVDAVMERMPKREARIVCNR
jgi:hypothetical protein